jgi:spermidine/putrescine transport system substrate-binding protein
MSEHEELQRLLAQQPRRGMMSRRDLLRRMGIGAGALSLSAFLAACGTEGTEPSGGDEEEERDPLTTNQIQGELDFANWPLYIDKAGGQRPTLNQFTKATEIEVNYRERIDDNQSFFGTIQEPLANGQETGWDLIVVTDWLIAKMISLGYLEQIDQDRIPNFYEHAGQIYQNRTYDPGNKYSVPWQSGITGIGYNPELTGREITSTKDLFDPEFEGRVGMMTEMRDTMNLILLDLGIEPQEATEADAEAAQEKLLEQRDAGIVRQYYGNGYADALARGDLALTMAWSGDVFILQLDNPELQFVVPDEGGILWTDNMAIPQNAPHPIDAMEMMNFVYQPEIAAQMAAYINYITPVPEAQPILADAKDAYSRQVSKSPLVFTTPEMESRLHSYRVLNEEEETVWNDLFSEVVQG